MSTLKPWTGVQASPGGIEIGSQEAEEAVTALVSAAVVLEGASAGPSTETKLEKLWRCGTLRSTSPSAMPLLKLAVKHADERYVLRELHCAQCCDADTAPLCPFAALAQAKHSRQ